MINHQRRLPRVASKAATQQSSALRGTAQPQRGWYSSWEVGDGWDPGRTMEPRMIHDMFSVDFETCGVITVPFLTITQMLPSF